MDEVYIQIIILSPSNLYDIYAYIYLYVIIIYYSTTHHYYATEHVILCAYYASKKELTSMMKDVSLFLLASAWYVVSVVRSNHVWKCHINIEIQFNNQS